MPETTTVETFETVVDRNPEVEATPELENLVEDDLLVEDVSIDGMCGVY